MKERSSRPALSLSNGPIVIWLIIGVIMLIIQILLGGVTRLTGSGLSITEWNVVTGTLPPLNEHQWLAEFDKYRQTPQYHYLNTDFTLKDFKFIFFWEWLHRFWARLIGVVFAIPFVIFLFQKRFRPSMVKPLIILFLLGALQGAIGWIMVASGLTGDAIYVKPTRLALHFIFALGLLCYTFWFALQLIIKEDDRIVNKKARDWTIITIAVLCFQLAVGALLAGHKAASAAPTWPTINGEIIPAHMNYFITLHFIHRALAYLIFILVIILTILLKKIWLPFFITLLQITLGVFTVLNSTKVIPNHWGTFEWLAQMHQLIAIGLLLSLVWVLYRVRAGNYHYI